MLNRKTNIDKVDIDKIDIEKIHIDQIDIDKIDININKSTSTSTNQERQSDINRLTSTNRH